MLQYFIQGFLLELAYVAPIGAQNLFVINTALTQRYRRVLLTAFAVTIYDVILALACFLGIGAIISAFVWLEIGVMIVGALIVVGMGIGLVRASGTMTTENVDMPVLQMLVKGAVVTWLNPQAIIDGTMLLGASRAAVPDMYDGIFIIGCVAASTVWWFGMSSIVHGLKTKISDKILRIINIVCGAFMIFYGCKLLYSGIKLLLSVIR